MSEGGRKTGKCGPFLDQPQRDSAIVAIAGAQHAVIGLAQLREIGLKPSAIRKRAATGRLHRIHRGVYSLVPRRLLTRGGHFMAAVLACGPAAVLSHRSAAAIHDLRRTDRTRIDVTVPGRSTRAHMGVEVHRSTTLAAADTTKVRNIPCTTVARSLLDLAGVINRRGVERAIDQAEVEGVLNLRAVHHQLGRNRSRRATSLLGAVLQEHAPGSTFTWSDFEEDFLALTRAHGIPDPEVNGWIVVPDGEPAIRADFLWRAQRVVVETDGHGTHRTRQAFERDRRNDQRLAAAGWRSIRATRRHVHQEGDRVIATVLALLRS